MTVAAALGWLTEPYGFSFMQRALLGALLVGVVSPLVGTWIVLRRLAYVGDAMGHATVSGVAVAALAGWSITAGALGAGLVMAALMALLAAHPRLRSDSIVGAVEVALFAAGVLLISRSTNITVDLGHVLFGSVTTVSERDLAVDAGLGAVVVAVIAFLFRDLRSATFDPTHAALVGVRVTLLRQVLLALVAVSVVMALQTVGLLMSIALLIVPAATARLWTRTVLGMSLLGAALGASCSAVGLTLSYHLSSAPGATIALTAVAVLAVSFAVTLPRRGQAPLAHAPGCAGGPAGSG